MEVGKSFLKRHWFAVAVGCFVLYFSFFDDHSLLKFFIYNHQAARLEKEIATYKEFTERCETLIQELDEGGESLEKYARERLLMKRENEDVYLIE